MESKLIVNNLLEKTFKTIYFPIAGLQALACGAAVAVVHSKPIRYINGMQDTNGFSKESATSRFREGIELVLTSYGYLKQ